MLVDPFKLRHWLNARKYTAAQVADLAGISRETIDALLAGGATTVPPEQVTAVAGALRIDPSQLGERLRGDLTVLHQTPEALHETRRPIQRDGIHFYNYYSMVAPTGRIAPVILDILCPAGRLPALNNGHLEPAITVNLGPGDIHGRWGEQLSAQTWQVLAASSGVDAWITGDSYIEPSYCPHAYSLATERPARIVSYTGQSNIAALADEVNGWSDTAFAAYLERLDRGLNPGDVFDLLIARRGYDRQGVSAAAGVSSQELAAAIADPLSGLATFRAVGRAVGIDYRLLLPPERRHDDVGKTCFSLDEARTSKRRFGPYEVASMASAPHLPDLTGLFLRVDADRAGGEADLVEPAECHYLVTTGEATLEWLDAAGEVRAARLPADASAWVGPFVRHRWSGHASLLKFGSGAHVGYLDLVELTNTYNPAATARRGRRDRASWGHDG
ncbi:helix-turn-helix domain-containing protein [Dactylosporangium siamense]|nr:helix-turn-helix domain-containing protein [Dactylosporangium siamense]